MCVGVDTSVCFAQMNIHLFKKQSHLNTSFIIIQINK